MKNLPIVAALLAAAAAAAAPATAREAMAPAGLTLDRVVLLMRHGVRPPTKSPPLPQGTANQTWPSWPVAPGYLTPHGAEAVRLVGQYDRARWVSAGVLPRTGCARVRIVADSDQRTIETARHYAAALAPGCTAAIEHKPQDTPDPLFSPINEEAVVFDPARARAAVIAEAGPRGIAREEARLRPLLTRLDAILCAPAAPNCGVSREASDLAPPAPLKRPKLTGALDRASTAAQVLLLEYADGKPMADVGWGRATAMDIARLSEFHAVEFRLLARPAYVAKANLSLLGPLIVEAVTAATGPSVTMISGHDTNVASLAGLLDLHWRVPGLAADDPSPGGAVVFERLHDGKGKKYVRALYRSQTVDQIRALSPLVGMEPYVVRVPIRGCTTRGVVGLCTVERFAMLLAAIK